jgi:hypothetical protein
MNYLFTSGSCRLLCSLDFCKDKSIHTVSNGFKGDINFLGKLHNVKQHIQFINYINNNIVIPPYILEMFLSNYNNRKCNFGISYIQRERNLKRYFNECSLYIFEICSLKLYENHNYQVQFELTNNYNTTLQTEKDLYNDLIILRNLIPKEKTILFQCHFRPNIIYNDPSKKIEKREIIYNVLSDFCKNNENTYLHDPSVLLSHDRSLFDGDTHFNDRGYNKNYNYLLKNYIQHKNDVLRL